MNKGAIKNKIITLDEAIRFHGHLGPYLVLGLLAGRLALKNLKFKKYFGLKIKVWGAADKPKSCLLDGLQLSTGATYGKGNINKLKGPELKIEFSNCFNNRKTILSLRKGLVRQLNELKTHQESELLAKRLFKTGNYRGLFNLTNTS